MREKSCEHALNAAFSFQNILTHYLSISRNKCLNMT